MADPFNLGIGASVQAIITATNVVGNSVPS